MVPPRGHHSDQATHGSADDIADEELAGDRERSAAGHQGSVDDPTTPRREDLDGQALGERDLHEAAASCAIAAENQGVAHAAVARAPVTTTPPSAAATPRPTQRPAGVLMGPAEFSRRANVAFLLSPRTRSAVAPVAPPPGWSTIRCTGSSPSGMLIVSSVPVFLMISTVVLSVTLASTSISSHHIS
jgi:hypothetical protein